MDPDPSPSHPQEGGGGEGVPISWLFSPHELPPGTASTYVDLPPLPPSLPPPPLVHHSAFVPYRRRPTEAVRSGGGGSGDGGNSMFRRMVGLLRWIRDSGPRRRVDAGSRGLWHMMKERRRREREKEGYDGLRALLPPPPPKVKPDKEWVAQEAISYMQTLKGRMEELQRENRELSLRMARDGEDAGRLKIRLRVESPSSPIDSMIASLGCFKDMEVKARSMQWSFHGQELRAEMDVESKISASELATAVDRVLKQVEERPHVRLDLDERTC